MTDLTEPCEFLVGNTHMTGVFENKCDPVLGAWSWRLKYNDEYSMLEGIHVSKMTFSSAKASRDNAILLGVEFL